MISTLKTFTTIASRILNEREAALDPDVSVYDLGLDDDEWRDMLEEACKIHGVALIDILNTAPVYRFRCTERGLRSLQDIAAFSQRAAEVLANSTTKIHIDTLRSLAASVEESRYVESGQMSEDLHQANAKGWVLGQGLALVAIAFGLPFLNAFGPCTPICRDCFAPAGEKFWDIGVFTIPAMFVIFAA